MTQTIYRIINSLSEGIDPTDHITNKGVLLMFDNLILNTDSYKYSHHLQTPSGTQVISSYIESRGGRFDRTVFFGLQAFIKQYLLKPITNNDIEEAQDIVEAHGLPFNRSGWKRIVDNHGGFLPLKIDAVPEGLVIPTHNVLVQMSNTDEQLPWVTNFAETAILRAVWYSTTVATLSWHCKQLILAALTKSSDDPSGQIAFKLHDFSCRGVSSNESSAIGGLAHLVNFMGTDTVPALVAARKWYGEKMAGFSIPAMEHSTVTSWGRDGETNAYANMLDQFAKPGALVACVSDSYDLWNAVTHIWGETLKQKVIDSGATIVVRPDSGDPLTVPVRCIELLGEKFGYTINSKGYKVLPSCIRVIQGDGITVDSIPTILENLLSAGWSADNLAFGMGAGLAQKVDRDTLRFAMKASAAKINGEWHDVFKDPITDVGKQSKKGRLILTRERGKWETLPIHTGFDWANVLTPIYENGTLLKDWTLAEIRDRSNQPPLV